MKIKIKRATVNGLIEAEGVPFEEIGMQFCLVRAEGCYYPVELLTGCSVTTIDPDIYSEEEALDYAKKVIRNHTEAEWERALKMVSQEYCLRYKFSIPVNVSVKV